jgi:hypothetical protein
MDHERYRIYQAASTQGPGALEQFGHWWLSYGLGALWWPGFLVCCCGLATWLKRRRPAVAERQAQLRELDRDHVNVVSVTAHCR